MALQASYDDISHDISQLARTWLKEVYFFRLFFLKKKKTKKRSTETWYEWVRRICRTVRRAFGRGRRRRPVTFVSFIHFDLKGLECDAHAVGVRGGHVHWRGGEAPLKQRRRSERRRRLAMNCWGGV